MKIALISCGGHLPVSLYNELRLHNHAIKIISFKEVHSELTADYTASLGQIGKIFSFLKKHDVQNIIFAGSLNRPNLWRLRFDLIGIKLVLTMLRFFKKGDDSLLRFICDFVENYHFKLWSIADLCPKLLMPLGCLTVKKAEKHTDDTLVYGQKILNTLAQFDIGQSIAIAGQIVLGIETIGGTDNMITQICSIDASRISSLPKPLLIKMRKKNQSNLVDLPTIGLQTIENLHKAGFAGAAFEAGGCLILDIQAVINRANDLGLYIIGFNND